MRIVRRPVVLVVRSLPLILAAVSVAHAWTSRSSISTSNNKPAAALLTVLHGSRAATRWERKQAWLEQRGGGGAGRDDMTSSSFAAEIIGAGRIGEFLATAGDCTILGRDDSIDPTKEGQPILIATRNDALSGIVEACPENRRKDLVFLQNGFLDNFLQDKGLMDNTQVLLYLSVPAKGATPVDGVTTVNPEGLTAATGVHAQAFADRLAAVHMKCNVVTPQDYRPAMFEKLM